MPLPQGHVRELRLIAIANADTRSVAKYLCIHWKDITSNKSICSDYKNNTIKRKLVLNSHYFSIWIGSYKFR